MRKDDNERDRQSFIRWQDVTRTQLTYAMNLIIGFSVAILGFQVSLLMNGNFILSHMQKAWFNVSLILVFFSLIQGIIGVLFRLWSFRITACIAKNRNVYRQRATVSLKRRLSKRIDKNTWRSFYLQLGLLSVGVTIDMYLLLMR